jgi:hypothetical protein
MTRTRLPSRSTSSRIQYEEICRTTRGLSFPRLDDDGGSTSALFGTDLRRT